MAKTVFILGAGASRHAGAPLMNEFLERAWGLPATSNLGAEAPRHFALVRKGINALQLAHSKGDLDIWNLEAVFDAFEMAALVGRLGDLEASEVQGLPDAMRGVILTTLQEEISVPMDCSERPVAGPTEAYARFVEVAASIWRTTRAYPAVITFNYDICLDWALFHSQRSWGYCLNGPGSGDGDSLRLLKLHGSLNWAFCMSCGDVWVSRDLPSIARVVPLDVLSAKEDGRQTMRLKVVNGPLSGSKCGCSSPKLAVMLVPPTINKGQHHNVLKEVWTSAAAELGAAEEIIVCGYSLPETDLFFRYLYAVGAIGEACLRRFWVLNPDARVKPRFQALLGRQVLSQPDRFRVFPLKFEDVPWDSVVNGRLDQLPDPV